MNFKIGDRVRFLNEVGGGKIIRLPGKKTARVQSDDGFQYDVALHELVPEGGMEAGSADEKHVPEPQTGGPQAAADEEPAYTPLGPEGFHVLFALVPEGDGPPTDADLTAYLVNDSSCAVYYHIQCKEEGSYRTEDEGRAEAATKIRLGTRGRPELNRRLDFHIQLLFLQDGFEKPLPAVARNVEIKALRLFKEASYAESDYFHRPAIGFELFTEKDLLKEEKLSKEDVARLLEEKEAAHEKPVQAKRHPKNMPEEVEEVDLHINALIDNYKGMSNGEIITVQLGHFNTKMDQAIRDGRRKIIFIHGVGNGTLKHELRKQIKTDYPRAEYQDASFKEYGFGATLVLFR